MYQEAEVTLAQIRNPPLKRKLCLLTECAFLSAYLIFFSVASLFYINVACFERILEINIFLYMNLVVTFIGHRETFSSTVL